MVHNIRILGLAVSAVLLPAVTLAQAPPQTKTPVAPRTEQLDPDACTHSDTQTTVGKGGEADTQRQDGKGNLSDKLARSGGVICPPGTRRFRDQAADPAGRQYAGHPAAGQPGWRPIRSAEVTAGKRLFRPLA